MKRQNTAFNPLSNLKYILAEFYKYKRLGLSLAFLSFPIRVMLAVITVYVPKDCYKYEQYIRLFSVVFQDFKLLAFPLGQNVAAAAEYKESQVRDCLELAGFGTRLNELNRGVRQALYRDFEEDGVNLSGGEEQKIAIARAIYKNGPFVILDEPTAALDPVSEYEIYTKFNMIIGSRTAVYISHRLSSCRFCDRIAVLHNGEIVETGGHEELLQNTNGKYTQPWEAQAKYYAV